MGVRNVRGELWNRSIEIFRKDTVLFFFSFFTLFGQRESSFSQKTMKTSLIKDSMSEMKS